MSEKFMFIEHPKYPWGLAVRCEVTTASDNPLTKVELLIVALQSELATLRTERDEMRRKLGEAEDDHRKTIADSITASYDIIRGTAKKLAINLVGDLPMWTQQLASAAFREKHRADTAETRVRELEAECKATIRALGRDYDGEADLPTDVRRPVDSLVSESVAWRDEVREDLEAKLAEKQDYIDELLGRIEDIGRRNLSE